MLNKFIVPIVDTDSLMICKDEQSSFSKEEIENLTKELNSLFPEEINWEFEAQYTRVIIAKAKNYILYDGKKMTVKGSAFKSSSKEIALKVFTDDIINAIIQGTNNYNEIFERYVAEIQDIKDITRWCSKKTISHKTLTSTRLNERKIKDALEGEEFQEGDKTYVYFKEDDSLGLAKNFDGKYNKTRLLKKLYQATKIFDGVLPTKELFINYSLKKNISKLDNNQLSLI